MAQWFVLCVEPNRDSRALFYLRRQLFNALCFQFRVTASRRRPHDEYELMFPGYLLIEDPARRWNAVLRTFSVTDALRSDNNPVALPDRARAGLFDLLDSIDEKSGRAYVNMGGAGHQQPTYPSGTPVRILSGPFEGLRARFNRRRAKERVEVFLSLLGGDVSAELDEEQIEAIDARTSRA